MGANMARRLKDCGYAVTAVYDVNTAGADSLAAEIGAKSARTLAEVTAAADVIFTVVTDDAAQLGVFAEQGDSLLTGAKGRIFVNCATITPSAAAPSTSIFAVTACDLFLTFRTQSSLSAFMPGYRNWVLPLTMTGRRPAVSLHAR